MLTKAAIKAAAIAKMCNFFLQNKDLDLMGHWFHCHHFCRKYFTHCYSCNLQKASPKLVATLLLREIDYQEEEDYIAV